MSAKYDATNTLMNDVSQSMIGRDRVDGNCRTNNNINLRNEFIFNSSRETNVATYNYLYKGNEHFGIERENGSNDRTFSKVPILEEPNTYKKYNADGIMSSEESREADLKKKKISDIINKYRNQLKMMQSQFLGSSESKKINEKENEQNYEKTNMHNQDGSNERVNGKEIGLFERNESDDFFREKDLAEKSVLSNSKVEEEHSPRVTKMGEIPFDVKPMEMEVGNEKFRKEFELSPNKISMNSSTLGMEKNLSISLDAHLKDDVLHQFKDKGAFDPNVENQEEYENLSLYQKKRMHIDREREKQIDFKKKKILNSQTRRSTEILVEEEGENLEKKKSSEIKKWAHENNKDDPLSFRHYIYDSIAFDEFKIKDKFKEIEQIEQLIRAKNLLSPVKNRIEEKKQCNLKNSSSNTKEITEKEENMVANDFEETKESNENKENDITKRNDVHSQNVHHGNSHDETFLVETSKEKQKGASKDLYDNRTSVELIHERDDNGKFKDNDVHDITFHNEEIKAGVETTLNKAFNEMKSVARKDKILMHEELHYPSDCNNMIINSIHKTTNYGTATTKISVAATDKNSNGKDTEGNANYKYSLSPIKPNFPIQEVANRIDKRQVTAKNKGNARESRNKAVGKLTSRNSSSDVKKSLVRDDWRKEKDLKYVKMKHPQHIKKNSLPCEEGKKKKERSSYCAEEILANCHKSREITVRGDNYRNYLTRKESYISSETNKLERVENGKNIPDSKENMLEKTKENSWNNVNQKCSNKEKENDIITKENMLMCSGEDNTTIIGIREKKEERTVCEREEKEPQFLFSNNFTQDRKLKRTVKTAYTEEFINDSFAKGKKIDEFHKWNVVGKGDVSSDVKKYKSDERNLTQSNMMIHGYEQETKCKNNNDDRKYELRKTKVPIRNVTDSTTKRGTINEFETSRGDFGRNEDRGQKSQIVMNNPPITVLNKSTDGSTFQKTQKKMEHALIKTYNGISVNNPHTLKGTTIGEMSIREKYEADYKLLEKLKTDIEEKSQQNQLFFSVNYSQGRNKNLRYRKFPDGLHVTYNDYSRVRKKRRSSIITDKVFEDDVTEKEEMGSVQNVTEGYMKDKKHSIERIQRELEIIKRHKDGKEIEAIDEHLLRDEIEQKRKLYEENIRKNFQEKIRLRRQWLEQQKEEIERQGCNKSDVLEAGNRSENEQSIRKKGMGKRVNYENGKKKGETKIKNIFDEYSSDGSYYRHLYKNLYDDECNKKWKNYFYDVSDNIYLQDCSDNFFSNLKKTPSEDVSCTNSIDLDLISLSNIKFDEFDYNYLNTARKKLSRGSTEKKVLSSSNSQSVSPVQRELNRNCTLKKPRIEFSDISEKESSKLDTMMHVVSGVNRDVLNVPVGETEGNGILCKLVKRKTMGDEKNNNRNDITECDDAPTDLALKNKEGNKMIVKEGTLSKETEYKCDDIQEEMDHIGNKHVLKRGLNKLSNNNVNNRTNEMNTKEMNRTKLNTTELNATELNTTELNTTELNATELNTTKLNTTELNTTELNTTELNTTELNTTELNTTENPKISIKEKGAVAEKKVPIVNNSLRSTKTLLKKRVLVEKSPNDITRYKIDNLEKKQPKIHFEKIQKKEASLKADPVKKNNKLNNRNGDVGKNALGRDLKKQLPTEIRNGKNKEKETFHTVIKEKKQEATIVIDEKNVMNTQEKEPVGEMFNVLKESSSTSSNKTMPKINILQNEQNYVPLDLALNFVMDDQKFRKKKKEKEKEKEKGKEKQKEKDKEPQRPNKKKTFTQWILDERKKRLKNNLPIDI